MSMKEELLKVALAQILGSLLKSKSPAELVTGFCITHRDQKAQGYRSMGFFCFSGSLFMKLDPITRARKWLCSICTGWENNT